MWSWPEWKRNYIVILAYRAPHDSGPNGTERFNGATGDAIVTGGVVDWQHFVPFDRLQKDGIASLTTDDVEILKKNTNKERS